jgi:ribosomal protein L12E/L44/L45/RPP1/RPP2
MNKLVAILVSALFAGAAFAQGATPAAPAKKDEATKPAAKAEAKTEKKAETKTEAKVEKKDEKKASK